MISTIKKLHELQLMAIGNDRISFDLSTFNGHWSVYICTWFNGEIKSIELICSSDKNIEHRIDMMIKHRVLEK